MVPERRQVGAFYDGSGRTALLRPGGGRLQVPGARNVNDNFIVDKLGNIVSNGSMTINGSLIMNGSANWLQTRYSTKKRLHTKSMAGGGTALGQYPTQVWVIYSYNGGQNWTQPMLAQGKDGAQERPPTGSAAQCSRMGKRRIRIPRSSILLSQTNGW